MVEQFVETPVGSSTVDDLVASLLKVNAATEETQLARLAALNGKRMLYIAGDFMYSAFGGVLQDELRTLRANGVYIVMAFQTGKEEGKYFRDARDGNCFDESFFADIGAENGAENIVQRMGELDIKVEYAFSFHESTQLIMANVQTLLGVPGNPVSAYEKARDKYATRKALQEAGLNTIRACQVWSMDDVNKVIETVGFPMVVKPTVGMGSAGVYKAFNEEDLRAFMSRIFNDFETDWQLNRSKLGKQAPIVAEELVMPTIYAERINEFDIEVLMWDGEVKYTNVLDNWISRGSYFQELGSSAPSLAPENVVQELKEYAAQCVRALGFTRGGFHVECWYTKTGPLLIEVNSRVGGGFTAGTHKAVWGVSPFFEFVLTMLDVPINPPRSLTPLCAYGFILPNAEVTGHLVDVPTYLEPAKSSKLHTKSTYYFKGGDRIRGNDSQIADWIGEVHLVESNGDVSILAEEMTSVIEEISKATIKDTLLPSVPQEE